MPAAVPGIHHVTSITGDVQKNVDFYVAVLGLPWQVCRGLAVMARAIGLVAHLQEEVREPMAAEIWARVEEEASEPPT